MSPVLERLQHHNPLQVPSITGVIFLSLGMLYASILNDKRGRDSSSSKISLGFAIGTVRLDTAEGATAVVLGGESSQVPGLKDSTAHESIGVRKSRRTGWTVFNMSNTSLRSQVDVEETILVS